MRLNCHMADCNIQIQDLIFLSFFFSFFLKFIINKIFTAMQIPCPKDLALSFGNPNECHMIMIFKAFLFREQKIMMQK